MMSVLRILDEDVSAMTWPKKQMSTVAWRGTANAAAPRCGDHGCSPRGKAHT